MVKVRIEQVRSMIDKPKDQKATLKALGLGKRHKVVEKEVNKAILGMLKKVSHLVKIEIIEK